MKLKTLVERLEIAKSPNGLNKSLVEQLVKRYRNLRHEAHYSQDTLGTSTDCGTACCIAGETMLLSGMSSKQLLNLLTWDYTDRVFGDEFDGNEFVWNTAAKLLGLTESQADILFSESGEKWPTEYRQRLCNAEYGKSNERPSRVAADLLEAVLNGEVTL